MQGFFQVEKYGSVSKLVINRSWDKIKYKVSDVKILSRDTLLTSSDVKFYRTILN